jgi:hypothetical protein
MPAGTGTPRRLLMADGHWWRVERRHEMAQLMTPDTLRERRLYIFFHGDAAALRRAEVPADFPERPSAATLRGLWQRAEILH